MELQNLAELLWKLQSGLTGVERLFDDKWYFNFLTKLGIYDFHALVMRAHNELVAVRGCLDKHGYPFAWDYKPFWPPEKVHRMLEDPLRTCCHCRAAQRLHPTLKNILLKKLGIGKYKTAVLLAVD